jgi:hypothetical protein
MAPVNDLFAATMTTQWRTATPKGSRNFDVFPLDAGLVARGQYSEGPATGHLDTGFSRFPPVFNLLAPEFGI